MPVKKISINPKAAVTVGDYLTVERLVRDRPSVSNLEKAVQIFPSSAMFWSAYLDFLIENPEKAFKVAERAVAVCMHIDVWKRYLNLAKSTNRLQAFFRIYEKAVGEIGTDPRSVDFWLEYLYLLRLIFNLQMLASFNTEDPSKLPPTAFLLPLSPVTPPGLTEDMLDPEGLKLIAVKPSVGSIREIFQNALSIPMERLDGVWDEYQAFEQVVANAMNALAAAIPSMPGMPPPPQAMASAQATKLIAEYSNRWIQSKQGMKEIHRIYASINMYFAPIPLDKTTAETVKGNVLAWRRVLGYEKTNPFKLNFKRFETRMTFVFKQCLMSNCYVSEFWIEYFIWTLSVKGYADALVILEQAVAEYLANDVLLRLVISYVLEETGDSAKAVSFYQESLEYFAATKRPVPSLLMHFIRFQGRCFSAIHARTVFLNFLKNKSIHLNEEVFIAFAKLELRVFANAPGAIRVLEMGRAHFATNAVALNAIQCSLADLKSDLHSESSMLETEYSGRKRLVGTRQILSLPFSDAQSALRFRNMWPTNEKAPITEDADKVIEIDDEERGGKVGGMRRPDVARMQPFRQTMDYEDSNDKFKALPKSLKVLVDLLPRCGSDTVPDTDGVLKILQQMELPPISIATFKRLEEDPQLDQIRRERDEAGVAKGGANLKRLHMDEKKKDDDVIIKSDLIDDEKAQRDFLSALASNIHRERVYYKRHKLVAPVV